MQVRSIRCLALLFAILLVVGLGFVDAGAQKRRRHRRVSSSANASPSPSPDAEAGEEPKIISTADQTSGVPKTTQKGKPASTPTPESEQESLRRTISELSGQVTKLSEKISQMEEQQRSLVDVERLSRAEQRAEGFRSQLRDVQAKETDLQGQLDQVEYALQPENIERVVGMFGTTHPEEAREQRRRQLEAQRTKLRAQYDQLEQSRVRLEAAIATADSEVDSLRHRMETANQDSTAPGATATPSPTPTPPEYQPQTKPPDVQPF
jgi:DNA repair exonuclease SbcCD ATPase subunit